MQGTDDREINDDENNCSDDELIQLLQNTKSKSLNEKNMAIETNLFEELSIDVKLKPAELLLMTFKYAIKNTLSTLGLINLLKLINVMFGTHVVPETRYFIDKLVDSQNNVVFHGVCLTCSKYLGIFEGFDKFITCSVCKNQIDVSCPSNPCFFAFLDPSNAIKKYLETHEDYYNYVVSQRVHEKNQLNDIFDEKAYRHFVKSLNDEDKQSYATIFLIVMEQPYFNRRSFLYIQFISFSMRFPSSSDLKAQSFVRCTLVAQSQI